MKIEDTRELKISVPIVKIQEGDCFMFHGTICIKTDACMPDRSFRCVCLRTGATVCFDATEVVLPVRAKVVIE